jgi:hypothetical protein
MNRGEFDRAYLRAFWLAIRDAATVLHTKANEELAGLGEKEEATND